MTSDDRSRQENMEQITGLTRGPKGDKGEQGGQGLPSGQARAIFYLFLLNLILIGAGYLFIVHVVAGDTAAQHREQAAQAAQERREQAAQRRAGEVIENKICVTLAHLTANRPPAGNPVTNPSRRYDQDQHAILDGLAPDLGCRRP